MSVPTPERLTEIAAGLQRLGAASSWKSIEVALTGAGGMLNSSVTVTSSEGVESRSQSLDFDTADACDELRHEMYEKGVGTWYNARITLDASGQVGAEFDYDKPPFGGNFEADLLIDDQEEYPRDEEHLPSWHPAKATS